MTHIFRADLKAGLEGTVIEPTEDDLLIPHKEGDVLVAWSNGLKSWIRPDDVEKLSG